MKKILLGAILSVAMVGCGTQGTPLANTAAAPDMQSILATHTLKPITTNGSNLLGNGNFEDGLSAWTACGDGALSISGDAQAGRNAAKLSDCIFQSAKVEVGEKYTLSCYVKETVNSGWTGIGFNFENTDWEIVNEQLSVEVTADNYTKYSISRRAPATAAYAAMWAYSDGTAMIDSCELVEGDGTTTPVAPTPASPTPVGPTPVGTITPMPPAPVTPINPMYPMNPAPVIPAPVVPVASNSIADIAVSAGLSKLVAALQLTNLDAVLADASGGPYTVFAPTDAAFDTLLDTLGITFEELAADADLVKEILLYHVIAYELNLETLSDAQAMGDTRFETLQAAEDIDFGVFGSTLYLDDRSGRKVTALQTDVMASNGVVHVIDSVLLPPSVQSAVLGY